MKNKVQRGLYGALLASVTYIKRQRFLAGSMIPPNPQSEIFCILRNPASAENHLEATIARGCQPVLPDPFFIEGNISNLSHKKLAISIGLVFQRDGLKGVQHHRSDTWWWAGSHR